MKNSLISLSLILLIGPSLVGCDKLIKSSVDRAVKKAVEEHQEAAAPELTPDQLMGEKLSEYVDCINKISERAAETAGNYFKSIDRDKGPTGKERSYHTIRKMYPDPKKCIAGIKRSNAAKPRLPELEASGERFSESLSTLFSQNNAAAAYYSEKDYKDDNFAKAKAMHPQMVKAVDDFFKADEGMRQAVVAVNDGLQVRVLKQIEKDEGKKSHYHVKNVMILAKELSRHCDAKSWKEIDGPAFDKSLAAYTKAVEEANSHFEAHEKEVNSLGGLGNFKNGSSGVRVEGKAVFRRKRDKTEFTQYENKAERPEGSLRKLLYSYNQLVGYSNSIRWAGYKPDTQ